ncbi:thioesterase family protein [Virgibacillus proomii]|uniref:thioesterase family protein n=1 Tax=Virgibacillus proomii TaxID=84407 RepID=UPI000987303B|nr:thioesterase [Virgibacillus proomii]
MKAGVQIGESKTMTVEVTKEMIAQFAGEVVHPVYSTASMVYHMEWVSRQLLIPYLEASEEGMGAAVSVKHLAPSGLGTKVKLTATISAVSDRRMTTVVTAENTVGLIGKGEVTQVILPKKVIQEKLLQVND